MTAEIQRGGAFPPPQMLLCGGPSGITLASPVIDRRYRLCRCSAPAPVKSGSAETQRRRLGLRLQRLLIAALILLNPFRVRKRLVGPLPTHGLAPMAIHLEPVG